MLNKCDPTSATSSRPSPAAGMVVVAITNMDNVDLASLAELLRSRLGAADTSTAGQREIDLPISWTQLSPEQRDVLRFVRRHESAGLNIATLASNMEFGMHDGASGTMRRGRFLSEKTIRKHCEGLFSHGLLKRASVRGPLVLTESGRTLVDQMLREESPHKAP